MKITGLTTYPASIGYRHVERSSRVNRAGVTDVVVKLTTDSGLVGWGESWQPKFRPEWFHELRVGEAVVIGDGGFSVMNLYEGKSK